MAKVKGLVWSKDQRTPRRQAPSVERIVRTAVDIADNEGLAALSMRRVAAELDSGTASLYRYVASRDELIDLMIDAVSGQEKPATLTGEWRADLRAVAHRVRTTMLRHPWLGTELTGRPTLGANSLRELDNALTAAAPLTADITVASQVVHTTIAYVFGAVAKELAEIQAYRRSGITEDEWRASVAPYISQVIASGDYPEFSRQVLEGADLDADQKFTFGLECVLDGVAARV